MFDVKITGGEKLERVAKRLRAAGSGGGLRRELLGGILRVAASLPAEVRASARDVLPSRGGLAARVAASRMTQTRMSGRTVGVRLVVSNAYNLRGMDAGLLRHPVFGRAGTGVTQRIPQGWISRPLEDAEPRARQHVERAVRDVADKITR
jgi:hypothetical protein